MNRELDEIIKSYTTGSHSMFLTRLGDLSKESVIALFTDLFTMYVNDKNSSTIREYVTVTVAGYRHSEGKIGFNGFKHSSISGGKPLYCEAKPRNIQTADFEMYKNGLRKTKPALLDAGGSFNDYTPARLKKDKQENPFILTSGFIDGRLMYILEIPFKSRGIIGTMQKQIKKRFPTGIKPGEYLRGARMSFKDYMKAKDLQVKYITPRAVLVEHKKYITSVLYDYLYAYAKS